MFVATTQRRSQGWGSGVCSGTTRLMASRSESVSWTVEGVASFCRDNPARQSVACSGRRSSVGNVAVVIRPLLSGDGIGVGGGVFGQHGGLPGFVFCDEPLVFLGLSGFQVGAFERVSNDVEEEGIVADLQP